MNTHIIFVIRRSLVFKIVLWLHMKLYMKDTAFNSTQGLSEKQPICSYVSASKIDTVTNRPNYIQNCIFHYMWKYVGHFLESHQWKGGEGRDFRKLEMPTVSCWRKDKWKICGVNFIQSQHSVAGWSMLLLKLQLYVLNLTYFICKVGGGSDICAFSSVELL